MFGYTVAKTVAVDHEKAVVDLKIVFSKVEVLGWRKSSNG